MKITIVGCGNAGLIHAAKLIERGFEVALLKTSSTNSDFYNIIKSEGGYNVKDETNGGNRFFVRPAMVTRNVEKAIGFADVIMVMTTTLQHESIAKLIAPYVRDNQIIVIVPGYMGSTLRLAISAMSGCISTPVILEQSVLPANNRGIMPVPVPRSQMALADRLQYSLSMRPPLAAKSDSRTASMPNLNPWLDWIILSSFSCRSSIYSITCIPL